MVVRTPAVQVLVGPGASATLQSAGGDGRPHCGALGLDVEAGLRSCEAGVHLLQRLTGLQWLWTAFGDTPAEAAANIHSVLLAIGPAWFNNRTSPDESIHGCVNATAEGQGIVESPFVCLCAEVCLCHST